jgi:hypothetical protein
MTYSEFVDGLMSAKSVFVWADYGYGVVETTKHAAMQYVVDSFTDYKRNACFGPPTAYFSDNGNGGTFAVMGCPPRIKTRIIERPTETDRYQLPKREDVAQFLR